MSEQVLPDDPNDKLAGHICEKCGVTIGHGDTHLAWHVTIDETIQFVKDRLNAQPTAP